VTAPDVASILLVDDNESKRYVLSSWLRRAGHTVIEAATGQEALALLGNGDINVVVLDVRLPDMTGFDVCEQIKAHPAHTATPVIHVSASAVEVADRAQGLSRGADAYLVEPIEPDELLATVQAVLRYYRARWQAERLVARLTGLAEMTLALNAAENLRQLLRRAVQHLAGIFESPAAVCAESRDGTRVMATIAGPGAEPRLRPWGEDPYRVADGSALRDQPAAAWPSVTWPDDRPVRVVGARPRRDRPASFVVVPAHVNDEGSPVLRQAGQALAAALESMRAYEEEHQIALTLQRSLLPRRLPRIRGYDLAVRYVPASDEAEIGGDFYELSMLDDGLLVAIGDVAGHSLHAATVMAELRHATRAYAAEGHSPSAILEQLNQLLLRMIPDEIATLCVLRIDPATGETTLANAGHVPPVLSVAGSAKILEHRSPLLGFRAPRGSDLTFTLPANSTLVLYTDGLVEQRGLSLDDGVARLLTACHEVDEDLDQFCNRLLAEVGPAQPADDIAVVTLRRRLVAPLPAAP
jgi:DNA-binding response OmpR family regulator